MKLHSIAIVIASLALAACSPDLTPPSSASSGQDKPVAEATPTAVAAAPQPEQKADSAAEAAKPIAAESAKKSD